jgi:predicted alpha/beta hydrolase family esterase
MPDIYAYNNKRYESFWLGLLGAEQLQLDSSTFVIADGTAADAVLRYAERTAIAGALLIGPGDTYHAAERHGRAYVWSEICRNSSWLGLLYCSERTDAVTEGRRVQRALAVPDARFKQLDADVCSDESAAVLAVRELVADYCSWRSASV